MTVTGSNQNCKPRWRVALGIGLVALSILAVVVSVGAPGIGWMLAVVTLYAGGLSAPRTGRRQLLAVLAIGLLHLFLVGPLAGFRWIGGGPGAGFVIFFVALPLATASIALCLPGIWRRNDLISGRS